MGKAENTRHTQKYPKYPERKKDTRKYPIVFFDTPTRPEPDPLPGILSNTRPDPILKNPTRWALPPWPPRILDNDKFEFPPSFSRICNSCGLSFVVSVVSVSNGWSAPERNSLLDDAASPVPVRLDVCQNKLSGCRFWGKKLRQKRVVCDLC